MKLRFSDTSIKLIFDFEAEASPIAISQAAILLSSWSPPPKPHCAQTGNFWLGVAVQQARLAGAHQYKSLYGQQGTEPRNAVSPTNRNILKRLWWSIIVTDRIHSLCAQQPLQVIPSHFSRKDMLNTLTLNDFVDEIERSRVYNSGAKRTLIKIFLQITQLSVVLTDLLLEILPPDEMARWDEHFSQDEQNRVVECKRNMEAWYDNASSGLFSKRDSLENASDNVLPEPAVGFAHDSVVLYTNLMRLMYQ